MALRPGRHSPIGNAVGTRGSSVRDSGTDGCSSLPVQGAGKSTQTASIGWGKMVLASLF
jgi:hypothetical protein